MSNYSKTREVLQLGTQHKPDHLFDALVWTKVVRNLCLFCWQADLGASGRVLWTETYGAFALDKPPTYQAFAPSA